MIACACAFYLVLSGASRERRTINKVKAPQCLGSHKRANFRVRRRFRTLNLRGPTLTAKLSEKNTCVKISGSTVL